MSTREAINELTPEEQLIARKITYKTTSHYFDHKQPEKCEGCTLVIYQGEFIIAYACSICGEEDIV